MSGEQVRRSRSSLSGRDEIRILIPTALLTLVVLSVGTLFAYRSTVEMMRTAEEQRATELALSVARTIENGPVPNARDLRQRLPNNARSTIRDPAGRVIVETSPFENEGELPRGNASFSGDGGSWSVQVELPSPLIAQTTGRLRVLVPLVLGINAAVVLLVLVYIRKLLMPLGQMLASAERSGRFDPDVDDEVDFLISTFDAAMRELVAAPTRDLESVGRLLVADLESGVLLCDHSGGVVALNAAGASLLGVEGSSFDGSAPDSETMRPLEEVLAAQPSLAAHLRRAMDARRGLSRQEVVLEGSLQSPPRTLGMTVHVLRRDDHEPRGFLVLFVDLTAARARASEQRLGETFAHVGEVAAGIAHELRNGVATLRGFLTLIERADGEDVADYAAELRRETEHLQRVVDDFLTLGRPGAARVQLLDVVDLIERAANDPALGEPIEHHLSDGAARATVLGDQELLTRALRNLLHNAVQASPGKVHERPLIEVETISSSDEGDLLEISVLDRGTGVPDEIRERLFHPFVSGRHGGVGLGLSLCLRIAQLHHGSLRIDSRSGGGTRAVLVLPLSGNESRNDADVTNGNALRE